MKKPSEVELIAVCLKGLLDIVHWTDPHTDRYDEYSDRWEIVIEKEGINWAIDEFIFGNYIMIYLNNEFKLYGMVQSCDHKVLTIAKVWRIMPRPKTLKIKEGVQVYRFVTDGKKYVCKLKVTLDGDVAYLKLFEMGAKMESVSISVLLEE